MPVEIKVPDMGESIIEATIARWIKQEGERVSPGEAVVELETDKVNVEVGAQQAGVLQRIAHPAGDTVSVGDVLAYVGEEGEGGSSVAQPVKPREQAAAAKVSSNSETTQSPETNANGGMRATPVAQRMAQEMGVDLSKIAPTGTGGRVTKEDVESFVNRSSGPKVSEAAPVTEKVAPVLNVDTQPAPAVQTPTPRPQPVSVSISSDRGEERQRMSRRRQTIARRLVEVGQTAAMLTTFNEIDMTGVMELRKRRRDAFKEHFGVDLGFMSFFVKASIGALKAFPLVNAEIQGDEFVIKHYYDIGIAIGAEEGLVVPVVRDADRLNFAGIEKAIRAFVDKSKNGTLSLDDLRGGTFTITNGGIYGSLMSTPILNPPQVGILGMHAIQQRPVAIDGQVVIRPMMYMALSYDHRIVDGREAVQFLVRIKELVQDPEALLLG